MGNGHTVSAGEQSYGGVVIIAYSATHAIIVYEERRLDPRWKFPGGGIDLNEPPDKAAKREFEEETGIALPLSAFWEFAPPKNNIGKHYFFVRLADRRLKKHAERGQDGEIVRLVKLDEIENMPDFLREHNFLLRLIPFAEQERERQEQAREKEKESKKLQRRTATT